MSLETTYSTLGELPEAKNIITITSLNGAASTDSFIPKVIGENVTGNPESVSGYNYEISESELVSNSEYTLLKVDSRLYQISETLEIVQDQDDRKRVTTTTVWPYTVQGHLIITFPNKKRFIGSGTMVGKHHVLTAGHCVYSKNDGGWATSVQFNAAQNDSSMPFGSVNATQLLSVNGWTDNNDRAYDMGMLILQSNLGEKTGWFGIITLPNETMDRKCVNVTGYPGDKGGEQLWTHADTIKSITPENAYYDIDTFGGQSGSGVWSTFDGHSGEKVACIHTTGESKGNGSTRILWAKYNQIVDWMQKY